jgi:hypothetical protein
MADRHCRRSADRRFRQAAYPLNGKAAKEIRGIGISATATAPHRHRSGKRLHKGKQLNIKEAHPNP